MSVKLESQQVVADTLWVQACLDLVNLPAHATDAQLGRGAQRVRDLSEDMELFVDGGGGAGRALRERLITLLRSWTDRSSDVRKPAAGNLEGVDTQVVVRVNATGIPSADIQYTPQDDDAVERLLTLFLHYPKLGIGERLRACELSDCGRFFLSQSTPRGGPRPKYCRAEHRKEADRRDAVNRMARKRRKEARRSK